MASSTNVARHECVIELADAGDEVGDQAIRKARWAIVIAGVILCRRGMVGSRRMLRRIARHGGTSFDEFGQRGAAAANAERPIVTTPKTPSAQVQSHCGSASILGLIGREFCPFIGDL